ncbi:hypothetical protein [methanotrophic endosymbiont of Bathymodiolus puteoserpentis (Logatchev)]|jgi:hypothetical protein|uniref:hypothetical protein n=1 Tax=methanotrophic endosymbiont of Bathymodiolus puteoserpentis (Logatchev) TaxID=343235 RepID=UPI00157B0600|nr:hypothetical protein [methanotrophic endosymbiont of Bathymodiolus puteoserpentis (Logatchev)]
MNLLYHRFIILLLLVLQGLSPLVHAHVQIVDNGDSGIHIDEISRIWQDAGDTLSFSNSEHVATAIDMQAVITQKKLLLDSDLSHFLCANAKPQFIHLFGINNTSAFADVFIVQSSVSLSAIAPRAPPL